MHGLIAFWTHAIAACLFASIIFWRLRERVVGAEKLLIGACFATVVWASMSAIRGPSDLVTITSESIRNLAWISLLYAMASELKSAAHSGLRLVFGAVALVIGIQLSLNLLMLAVPLPGPSGEDVLATEYLLRITMAAGALVLVHNIYGQAAPESRIGIRGPMLALTLMWGYDLNLYTVAYLRAPAVAEFFEWRGVYMALLAPLFALGSSRGRSLNIKLSRAATFQSVSLIAVCAYLAIMAILATALRRAEWDWASASTAVMLVLTTLSTAMLVLSQRVRGWVKVKLAKNLFEHRYDYRSEWLRFAETVGRSGPEAPPLGERLITAFAEMLDAPGGLLLIADLSGALEVAASHKWPGATLPPSEADQSRPFWEAIERQGRILDLDAYRRRLGHPRDLAIPVPGWIAGDDHAWAGVPLVHHERLIGLILIAAPDYRRPLDWEDFDLLRTAGRQAASSLAEALSQEALSNARRFEEFNRRFAFILHDIKNLVSQLSLLARNAERHADNAEFRVDMVATLKGSVGKLNELLARLSPQASHRALKSEPQPLRPILTAAIAAKRRDHDVRLLGPTSLWARIDSAALEQAVGHLVQNAVEASPSDQPINVRVAEHEGEVAITIADKGCGMDSDFIRNSLFQPFASTKPDGFGIGAFEARGLILAMRGNLTVDSRPGEGTTFTITLPGAQAADEPTRKIA